MRGIQIHPTLGTAAVLLCIALSAEAATNALDETASRLLGAEERLALPKEGAVAEPSGYVTHTSGRRLGGRRIEKPTKLDFEDKLETAPSSQALILTPQQAAALGPEGLIQITQMEGPVTEAIRVVKGRLYFKSIGAPQPDGVIRVLLPSGELAPAGTEFYVEAFTNGTTRVLLLDGKASLSSPAATNAALRDLEIAPGDTIEQPAGAAPPVKHHEQMSKHLFNETVQWCLYYPAVLFTEDLSDELRQDALFRESLRWYDTGAVQLAWKSLPPEAGWNTDEKKLYAAALLLALGDVERAQALLGQVEISVSDRARRKPESGSVSEKPLTRPEPTLSASERLHRLASALRQLIAAVKFDEAFPQPVEPQLSTEWLASSYRLQSSVHDPRNIDKALRDAIHSVTNSPQATNFANGWAQVAALQFSRGHVPEAQVAITNALHLAPSNAAPHALQGFLFAAQDRRKEAEVSFQRALELNSKLGDAWLGLGLMSFHHGNPTNGLHRLQIAVVHEPQRSVLRSYLGKGYYETATYAAHPLDSLKQLFTPGDTNRAELIKRAEKELNMARLLDPKDPTPELYDALIKQQQNRINEAVRDLEHSKELNENRRLYRSGLLLDQDQAVRSANLAAIYRDAGMTDWSVREAGRAVNSDYANYSAHLFLANSYDALRDPQQVNLRYETPWFNELLLANLLAPVGAGSLSQNISQQEYSRLFDHDKLGISSTTEYLSSGEWTQDGSLYGNFGTTDFAFDAAYTARRLNRPNSDSSVTAFWGKAKQQLSAQDTVFLQVFTAETEGGDASQHYDPASAQQTFRFKEEQDPNVFLGYHHEWAPGMHTLVLAAHVPDDFTSHDSNLALYALARPNTDGTGLDSALLRSGYDMTYRQRINAHSVELQQIAELRAHTLVGGIRFQKGTVRTESLIADGTGPASIKTPELQDFSADLERLSIYAYDFWQLPFAPIRLSGGLSYDRIEFPDGVNSPPISNHERTEDQLSPKAGFIWNVRPSTTVRGSYTRSLGGLYYDASLRLEPSQIAGFTQAYRSLIPESVAPPVAGSRFEIWGLALDQQFSTGTYVGVTAEILRSKGTREFGVLSVVPTETVGENVVELSTTEESLDFEERTAALWITQLLADCWTLGAEYRISDASLEKEPTELLSLPPKKIRPVPDTHVEGTLQQVRLFALLNTPAGFFARAETLWNRQSNRGYGTDQPGDNFWQHNLLAGYRFRQRRADITVGVLNLLDEDYQLEPLNLHAELPHARTFFARLHFSF